MRWRGKTPGNDQSAQGRGGREPGLVVLIAVVLIALGLLHARPATAVLPGPRPLAGAQPYATILCEFSDAKLSDRSALPPVSYYDRLMLGGPGSLDDYWRQVSYGAINLTGSKAFGWYQMSKPSAAYQRSDQGRADLDALARDCTAAAQAAGSSGPRFEDYVGINLVFSSCLDRSRGGAIDLKLDGRVRNYRVTWLCPGYASSNQILAHEIGHSFGLTHSEDGQGSEYGNNWDVMSNAGYCAPSTELGTMAQQPIAYDKAVLGWIAPQDQYTTRGPEVATVQIDYLGQGRTSAGGFLLAKLPLPGGRFYTIEARDRTGYDAALPAAGVLIHEIDPRRENRARLVTAQPTIGEAALLTSRGGWPVGSTFIDADNNVGVSIDAQVASGFVVTLYTGNLPWPVQPAVQAAAANAATTLRWRGLNGVGQYEVQVARLTTGSAGNSAWGATFVATSPTLVIPLAPGHYRWQVRALPEGPWSPPQDVTTGRQPAWRMPEQVAQLDEPLRVPPMLSVRPVGSVELAWAQQDAQANISVTRAAWRGDAWAVEDNFSLPSSARSGLALSFTPTGELKVAWPTASADGVLAMSTPAIALDAGGRAHTLWTGASRGMRGLFSAVVDAHEPSAGPVAPPTPSIQAVRVTDDADGATRYSPALALDGAGNAQAIWLDTRDGHAAVYAAEQSAGGTWLPARRLSEPGVPVVGRPALAVDAAGNAYAVWQGSRACGGPTALAEFSFVERPAGGEWQRPITLAAPTGDGQLLDPVVAANDAGEIYIAWGEIRDGALRLYAVYRGSGDQWESPRLVAQGQTDAGNTPLSLAVNAQGDAFLSWTESRLGRTFVRFAATR